MHVIVLQIGGCSSALRFTVVTLPPPPNPLNPSKLYKTYTHTHTHFVHVKAGRLDQSKLNQRHFLTAFKPPTPPSTQGSI